MGCRGGTLWLTGLSGSGKSTIASAVEQVLVFGGRHAYRLDGDNIRHGLNKDLGFSAEDRQENVRRIGEVAKLFAGSGSIAIASFISPFRRDRDLCRQLHQQDEISFLEVFVDAPLAVCEQRDPKGLYKKARAGGIDDFTGVQQPYEAPEAPDLVLRTADTSIEQCVEAAVALLSKRGLWRGS